MTPGWSPGRGTTAPADKRSCPPLISWVLLISAIVLKASLISICLGRGWMCCPKGWKHFEKSCYYISDDRMGWAESVQNCTGMGSHLVVINTKAEQAFLTNELQQVPKGENYYIGLRSQEVGQWQWVDQTPYNKSAAFWREGEPNHLDDEMCVVIHTSSEIRNWNDIRCESLYRICEAAAVTA